MNLSKLGLSLALLLLIVFTNACKPEDATPLTDYSTGVLIINEGAFQTGTGTINHYNRQDAATDDIFGIENNKEALGNIVQSMTIYNGKAYIMVNNANKMVIVDSKTFKNPQTITGITYPNQFLPIDATRAYISEWGEGGKKGAIKMYDFATKTISKTILTGALGTSSMLRIGSYVWATNNSGLSYPKHDSTIVIIDVDRDSIINTIKVGDSPNSIVQDVNGDIWVLCTDSLVRLRNGKVDLSFKVPEYSSKLTADLTKSNLYFIGGFGDNKVYHKDLLNFGKTPPSVFINSQDLKTPYALGFDPKTGYLYCGDAKDSKSAGTVYIFDPATKALKGSTKTGVGPNGFIFQ